MALEAARSDPSGRARRTRRIVLPALVLLVLCAICAPFFVDQVARGAPEARSGVVDYSTWGPLTKPVELRGSWRLTWHTAPVPGAQADVPVPGSWRGLRAGGRVLPESGAATYSLRFRGLPAGRYILYVPKIYGASQVVADGRVLSQRGDVGLTAATSHYRLRPHELTIDTDGSALDLRIDVSTFHYATAGIDDTPVFGLAEPMSKWISLDWMRTLLLVVALLLLACYSAVVFAFRPQDRASLYLAIAAMLLLPLVALLSHDNLLLLVLPDVGFTAMMAFQLVTSSAAFAFTLAYIRELFPHESPRWLYWPLQVLITLRMAAYGVAGALGDPILMSHFSEWAAPLRVVTLAYILGVVAWAVSRRREGSGVFLFGLSGLAAAIVYTDLATNGLLPRTFGLNQLPIGVVLLLFSQIVILAQRWSLAIEAVEGTNADLRRLLDVNISISSEMRLDALLKKIVEATSRVIHADRSSLFLYEAKSGQLWSAVAEGLDDAPIRISPTEGLAGWVFTNGQPLNLTRAYDDPRFNRQVDLQTGYVTRSVLTVPVTARDGRRLGVMQALNRQDRATFDDADAERMTAFAAQAAVALDNATLFSEVTAERNYNQSILRSMSSGVVTLDAELKVAKLNVAAASILEIAPERLDGADVRAWLQASNPTMLEEIEDVAAGGASKALFDEDVRTAQDRTISANLSIVPLVGEEEGVSAGVLVLIEDISESKRMQGAMRRFMTQKVVDQVMGRGDELLFGAACPASVLFADIRSFTSLSEKLPPREVVEMLNEIFTELFEAVAASDGVLDKFMGDGLMAVYGAPLTSGRDALNAVDSAVQMIRAIEALNAGRAARGLPPLRLGIGITSGEVVAGTIGSPKRMDYTVIGDSVNLAARLQSATKAYGVEIIVDEATAAQVAGRHLLRELDTIRVRGREQPVTICQVLTDPAACPGLDHYRRGLADLRRRAWGPAADAFADAVAADPGDRPAALMLERALALAAAPPADAWDGVWESAGA